MTIKHWGIKLKKRVDPEDPRQRSLQVAFSPFAPRRPLASPTCDPDSIPGPTQSPPSRSAEQPLLARRRTVVRMLRVELEATLALLSQALEQARSPSSSIV